MYVPSPIVQKLYFLFMKPLKCLAHFTTRCIDFEPKSFEKSHPNRI